MPKTPVVFVPGLGGSFNLTVLLDWRGPTLNGWNFPPFLDYGKTFLDSFTRAGYTRDVELFVAFYDWRKPVNDSASNYLMPWIDRARSRSGSAKVILVGHSMGGLVSRSYIQSTTYRDDVERLITLGTPHRGAPEAYYPWEGGELRWDPTVNAVLNVYLWYLEHIHPFQSGLDILKTIRTQAPGIRDLLSLDSYLLNQGSPTTSKPINSMSHRNLWGDVTLATSGLSTLLARTPLTTISGAGFTTVQSLVVQAAPPATDDPPRYVDGKPVDTQTTGDGDGTVLLRSARIDDPRVRNLPSVPVVHDQLPDKAVAQLMTELGVTQVAALETPAPTPKLVIMTASPVELTVELPSMAPAVLGAEETPTRQRPRRVRGTNYGHKGKRLNMAVITQPAIGTYNIRLRGTGAGSFALGALIVGVQSTTVLSADPTDDLARSPAVTPISTTGGQVAEQTELLYQVECISYAAPPRVRFDAAATSGNVLTRLSTATAAPAPVVLGAEEPIPQVQAVLSAADAPESLRTTVRAALVDGDQQAITELITLVSRADATSMQLLIDITEQVVGVKDRTLALGLLEQLRQIAELRSENEER
jgi:pimeloyl-ACP methyl ester carboxylesterase